MHSRARLSWETGLGNLGRKCHGVVNQRTINMDPQIESELEEDPIFRNSLREARVILSAWVLCFLYTVSYCYLNGYLVHEPNPAATGPAVAHLLGPLQSFDRDPDSLTYPLGIGIPDWIFYGVVLPWMICIGFSFWYGLVLFKEDELGSSPQESTEADE